MRTLLLLLALGCTSTADTDVDTDVDSDTDALADDTARQLQVFYDAHGGREAFPEPYVSAIEALLYAQDDIAAGDHAAARARIDAVFADRPVSDPAWRDDVTLYDLNVGDPLAYYGLRMLDKVLRVGPTETRDTLRMTAVVAPCASVRRPTLPDLTPETVELDLDAAILADDARVLHQSTALFRTWVKAITGGSEVELVVHTLEGCDTTVDYTDDGSVIFSYPDADAMVAAVPDDLAGSTDLWWVVAPSGVPGDGSGADRHFITGGMSGIGPAPLFLSDDAWFLRKPEHLGSGAYSDVERRVYQPQWFQHEFMHHLFRTWPELGLEASPHQWFDRDTWPEDFEGIYEPDYYSEAIDKRFDRVGPTLAEGLTQPDLLDPSTVPLDAFVGSYLRSPRENGWHEVEVTRQGDALRWSNADGVSWSMAVREAGLFTGRECPYGVRHVVVEGEGSRVDALWFGGEAYRRQ